MFGVLSSATEASQVMSVDADRYAVEISLVLTVPAEVNDQRTFV